jgi:oligopeptide/dipeptide ABC transporter ATP-binding protein
MSLDAGGQTIDLVDASSKQQRTWRSHVGVVFQEPSASLNPLQTVGRQLRDVIRAQAERDIPDISERVVELLTAVGLPRPAEVARLRPSQISGGMAQRVMIALALAKEPALLVADEPTTALDVTVQAEIIGLLKRLCQERHFAVLLVTHDLGVAGELSDRCLVMFRGELVESGPTRQLATKPKHPYTSALVSAVPQNEPGRPILHPPPSLVGEGADDPLIAEVVTDAGCNYRTTCPHAEPICATPPEFVPVSLEGRGRSEDARSVKCHRQAELQLPGARTPERIGTGA